MQLIDGTPVYSATDLVGYLASLWDAGRQVTEIVALCRAVELIQTVDLRVPIG
ncbi:MAG: hypothetical protein M3452_09220 [Chloroflexota bacterium]|nr:hypothetical protein [Chloroflexota bacterium]